jgi:hypothetical protein
MRVLRSMLVVLLVILAMGAGSAQAQVYHGNDTGGIIPWSCENEAAATRIAAAYCARWDKYYRITSVHPHYGDYIAFSCLWAPYVNPYALPAVRPRSTCSYEPTVRALY